MPLRLSDLLAMPLGTARNAPFTPELNRRSAMFHVKQNGEGAPTKTPVSTPQHARGVSAASRFFVRCASFRDFMSPNIAATVEVNSTESCLAASRN
jgi:hypothetical protein